MCFSSSPYKSRQRSSSLARRASSEQRRYRSASVTKRVPSSTGYILWLVYHPRSMNPITDPIGSGRIRPSDEIRSESRCRITNGSDGRISVNFQWYPIVGILQHFPIIGSDRIMLDYGNPCFFRQNNMSVRIRPQEYSQKPIHGLIDSTESDIPTPGSDEFPHQDPIDSERP